MTDYISRDKAAKVLCMACGNAACDPFECSFYKEMEDIPAADVVEVVRCKDCKFLNHDAHGYWCINNYENSLDPEKDFCSRAEPKNEKEQEEKQ